MAAKSQVDKYLDALARLKARGEPINNDAVAKEAGSGKGSIKKSRPGYAALIAAIDQAALEQKQVKAAADPTPQLRLQLATLQQRLDSALEREVCLLNEVYLLREENRQLKQGRLTVVSG
jgi:signal transduction protein with GAF and PtsI domain